MSRKLAGIACLLVCGCTYIDERGSGNGAPASPQKVARYMPPADQYVKSKLIDFDSPYDTTFVVAGGVKLIDDPEKPGNRVMLANAAQVKLGALVRGREFPGVWDLLGVRMRADSGTTTRLSISTNDAAPLNSADANVSPGWAMHWIELKKLPTSMPADQELLFTIRSLDGKPLQIDDVVLAQSKTTVSQSIVPESGESWRVGRSALRWQVLANDQELLALPAAPFVDGGYRVIESNPVRTVFASPAETIAIDRTGRLIANSSPRLDAKLMTFAKAFAENESPATIEVDADSGRVERNLPGDRDNDGYDESRGCYTVRAAGGRVDIRLSPGKAKVSWPVIEVLGLPQGQVSVWLEGQLVPWVTRLSDGKAIIELPVKLERPVEAQIRVK